MEERLGRSSFKFARRGSSSLLLADRFSIYRAPSLDTINRSIRNVTAAAHEKAIELDSLAGRLDLLRLQPSSLALSTRHRSPSIPTAEASLSSSVFRASPNVKSKSVVVKPDAVDTAKRALEAERRLACLKTTLLSVRKTPLLNQAAEESTSKARTTHDIVDLNLAFAEGAITAGHLPRPRRPPTPAVAPTPVKPPTPFSSKPAQPSLSPSPAFISFATPQAPAPNWTLPVAVPPPAEGTPPPLTFKAPISFSFAPSTVTSSPPTTAGAGPTSRTRGSGSSRAHSSAVQLRSGGSPSAPAVDPAAFWSTSTAASTPPPKQPQGFQSLNFGAPPSSTPTSFGGFGIKQEESHGGEQVGEYEEDNVEEEYDEWEGEDEEDEEELGLDTVDEEDEE